MLAGTLRLRLLFQLRSSQRPIQTRLRVVPPRDKTRRSLVPSCVGSEGETSDVSKSVQRVIEGGKETRRNLDWSKATVVENKAASVDGSVRVLVLSIEDHNELLDGRRLKSIQDAPRWVDGYTVPGQFVGVRGITNTSRRDDDGAEMLLPITSSPNEAREASALLDATILEVLIDRSDDADNGLGSYAPGDTFEVTQALGRGFSSLFSTHVGLQSALEEKRGLLMICYGSKGLGLMRSALNWTPVMALATAQYVSCILMTPNMISAACVTEWDRWRANGVKVIPVYENPSEGNEGRSLEDRLEDVMFGTSDAFSNLVKYPMECAVMMAGLPSKLSALLTKRLTEQGVSRERFLFCEFF